MKKYRKMIIIFMISMLCAIKPLAFKAFDLDNSGEIYGRGDYLIVLGQGSLETYLTNENLGGDFIKFKQSQGFNVHIISFDDSSLNLTQPEDLRDYIHNNFDNGMLEYVLLIGDVNGSYAIPPFAIVSYNEQETDVTDYPYTFTDDAYAPHFFLGRWPIRTTADFLNTKLKNIKP